MGYATRQSLPKESGMAFARRSLESTVQGSGSRLLTNLRAQ
jgi:hypothetical protein